MSELTKLIGQSKKFTIGTIELEIKPRTLKDIELIVDMANDEKRGEAMKQLIRDTLKDAVPDATDEEIDSIGIMHFQALSEAIMDVNGLNETKSD